MELPLPPGDSLPVFAIAKALNCTRGHVIHLIEAGELPAVDLRAPGASRSTLRVARQSLLDWMESRTVIVPPSQAKFEGKRPRIAPTQQRHKPSVDAFMAALHAS